MSSEETHEHAGDVALVLEQQVYKRVALGLAEALGPIDKDWMDELQIACEATPNSMAADHDKTMMLCSLIARRLFENKDFRTMLHAFVQAVVEDKQDKFVGGMGKRYVTND